MNGEIIAYTESVVGSIYSAICFTGLYAKWLFRKEKRKYYYDDPTLKNAATSDNLIEMNNIIDPVIYPYFIILFHIEGKRYSSPLYTNPKLIKSFSKFSGKEKVTVIHDDYKSDDKNVFMAFKHLYTDDTESIAISSKVISAN
jgi:hypothetical protein